MLSLTDDERKRYARQLMLQEIGETGQIRLKTAKVLVVGTGGLGSSVLYYLAAAGIGTLGVADNDAVDLSNLQRQILHTTADLGCPKTVSAFQKLARLNPGIDLVPIACRVTEENVNDIISGYEVIVDATDNFSARFILNKACVNAGKPLIHGAILGFFGQAITVVPGQGPCYRCIFHEHPDPQNLLPAPGVLGAVAGTIGAIQAAEVVKIVLGKGKPLLGRLLTYDALEASFREVQVKRNPSCFDCGYL